MSADLGLCVSDEARASLRKEYKRKMDEDTMRVKKERQTAKHNKGTKQQSSGDKEDSPVFDYGQLIANDAIKIELFKEIVDGFRTPQQGSAISPQETTLPETEKLKGYIHVSGCLDFPEEARKKARTKMMQMLDLLD